MTLAGLALRNLRRNRLRVGLTVAGVAIAIVAFLLLRTVTLSTKAVWSRPHQDRLITRHKITPALPLPKHYVDDVRAFAHIKAATGATWIGFRSPTNDKELFNCVAVDAATYFEVFTDKVVPPNELEAFKSNRQGAIVGDGIAQKFGWKVGDRVIVQSAVFGDAWPFVVEGIYTPAHKSVGRIEFLVHEDFVEDTIPVRYRGMVEFVISRVDDLSNAAEVASALDRVFADRDPQTITQDELTASSALLGGVSAVLRAIDIVSAVILIITMLVLGNTIAMGVRERTNEYGVLRAIGFLPAHVALWVVGESLLMGAAGGVLGAALAWSFIHVVINRLVEENFGLYGPGFELGPANMGLGVLAATAVGAIAAAIPAWQAAGLRVVEAVRRVA